MENKLTITSYVVLGIIARLGSCSPYDLKRTIQDSIDCFWSFPHSQLYAEPEHLKKAGYVTENREESGRKRRFFTITEQGRQSLQEWLSEATENPIEIRDVALLKLFFGDLTDPNAVQKLAKQQTKFHQKRFAEIEAICATNQPDSAMTYPLATLEMVLLYEKAAIAFWSSLAEQPISHLQRIRPQWETGKESAAIIHPGDSLAKDDESFKQSAIQRKEDELPDYLL